MAQTAITTTVTTNTSVQQGSQLVVDSVSNTSTVGNFVTGVSLQPYIASRIVSFFAYNMRPNQRMHMFFDSVLVDQYCAPAVRNTTSNTYNLSVTNTSDFRSIPRNGDWGTPIFSDKNGLVAGQFLIPEAKFRTGERVFQITDVDSLVMGSSALTTMSSATFVASNLNVTRESITLTTITPELSYVPLVNTMVTSSTNVTIRTTPDNIRFSINVWEPVAQSLTINTPDGESGIFATSLELFFRQKPVEDRDGVTVYLTEMDNGYPNGNKVLPLSTVHKNWSEINVSNNASSFTKFTFESPIFMASNSEYAFVIKPDSNNPDYQVWTANLGDTDVRSNTQVYSQPLIGTAFYGATTKQWTALQTEYVKFILNRANFLYGTGEATFYNANTENLSLYNISYASSSAGILPGDFALKLENSGAVNPSVRGEITYYDSDKNILYLDNTVGTFVNNMNIQIHRFANNSLSASALNANSSTNVATANTGNLHNISINALVPQLATISPPGTSIKLNYKGTSNTGVADSTEIRVVAGTHTEFYDKERVVTSKSLGTKSFTLKSQMTTDSEYVSPVIDTVKNLQLAVQNDVDPIGFDYDEFFSSTATKTKYISKVVTLAEGQDSQDLQVILSAFRPYYSDIQVWCRVVSAEDPESITTKTWAPMYNDGADLYSDPSNPNDFREFSFGLGSFYTMISTTGLISVANTTTTVLGTDTEFSTELKSGWYINMAANSSFQEQTRKVSSITNDTQLTLSSAFYGNYTSKKYFLVPPPTTPWLAVDKRTKLTGNVAVNTTNNSIFAASGATTSFLTELRPGSIISVAGDSQVVVSISNNSHLFVGTPWSSTDTNINGYVVSSPGVNYLNDGLSLFTGFKQFQLKIILQSDDSSKIPIIDDLRVLALQV